VTGPNEEVAHPVSEPLRLNLTSSPAEVTRAAENLDNFAAAHKLSAETLGAMQLALEEILVNVIKHGYRGRPGQPIDVEVTVRAGEVLLCVEDSGPPFNPLQAPPPDLTLPMAERQPGGLGIHLVKLMMDRVDYERAGAKNRLTLRKRL
jgi:anti-sigma regulatory factor (Ser/Thr protein kinase)